MSNAAGLTWDFGVIPYEPAPFQWARRYRALMDAHERYGLCGTVDAHHFGWWPSVICEMAKWSLWEPETPLEELAAQLARRDYGAAAAPSVLDCWRKWSEAMTFYIPTDEDQYGPFRIGPSYPLILQVSKLGSKNLKLPGTAFSIRSISRLNLRTRRLASAGRIRSCTHWKKCAHFGNRGQTRWSRRCPKYRSASARRANGS